MQGSFNINLQVKKDTKHQQALAIAASRMRSISPNVISPNYSDGTQVCLRIPRPKSSTGYRKHQGDHPYTKKESKPKPLNEASKTVYFNPYNKGNEDFVKRNDIP
jgi:hypothetical protein